MERGARQATVHGVAKSQTQLSNFHFEKGPGKSNPGPSMFYLVFSSMELSRLLDFPCKVERAGTPGLEFSR